MVHPCHWFCNKSSIENFAAERFTRSIPQELRDDFRNFWRDRVVQEGIAAKSANREIGQLSGMIKVLNILRRLGLPDPFKGLRLKSRAPRISVLHPQRASTSPKSSPCLLSPGVNLRIAGVLCRH
jgi:hypothetical protein